MQISDEQLPSLFLSYLETSAKGSSFNSSVRSCYARRRTVAALVSIALTSRTVSIAPLASIFKISGFHIW